METKNVLIGVITRPHGIRGEVVAKMFSDDPAAYQGRDCFFSAEESSSDLIKIEHSRMHKGMLLLQVEGIFDRNDAELLRGKELFLPKDELSPVGEGEYYYTDLIGLEVFLSEQSVGTSSAIGKVQDVYYTGANHVLAVVMEQEKNGKGRPLVVHVPFIDDAVVEVDVKDGFVSIRKAFLYVEE